MSHQHTECRPLHVAGSSNGARAVILGWHFPSSFRADLWHLMETSEINPLSFWNWRSRRRWRSSAHQLADAQPCLRSAGLSAPIILPQNSSPTSMPPKFKEIPLIARDSMSSTISPNFMGNFLGLADDVTAHHAVYIQQQISLSSTRPATGQP